MYKVDFQYYKNAFGGNLSEDEFKRLSRKAVIFVDNLTFGRLSKLDVSKMDEDLKEKVNMCICEVVEKINSNSEDGVLADGVKTSESVENWSVTYAQNSVSSSLLTSFKSTVEMYLGGTYLLCAWC